MSPLKSIEHHVLVQQTNLVPEIHPEDRLAPADCKKNGDAL